MSKQRQKTIVNFDRTKEPKTEKEHIKQFLDKEYPESNSVKRIAEETGVNINTVSRQCKGDQLGFHDDFILMKETRQSRRGCYLGFYLSCPGYIIRDKLIALSQFKSIELMSRKKG